MMMRVLALGGLMVTGMLGWTTPGQTASCSPGEARYAGLYTLNGVMEVGSQLLLNQDGSFEFMLAYGANDQAGKGCWVAKGQRLEVIPPGKARPRPRILPMTAASAGWC